MRFKRNHLYIIFIIIILPLMLLMYHKRVEMFTDGLNKYGLPTQKLAIEEIIEMEEQPNQSYCPNGQLSNGQPCCPNGTPSYGGKCFSNTLFS